MNSLLYSIDQCIFLSVPHCLDHCSFIVSFRIKLFLPLYSSSPKTVLAVLGSFTFYINFGISLSMSAEKLPEISVGIVLEI